MASNARVRVYDSRIAGEFLPGGDAWGFTKKVTREIETEAIVEASTASRSGDILRSHRRNVIPGAKYGCRGFVVNTSDHALYKHEGTVGPITPTSGDMLRLSPGGGFGVGFARSVAGQRGDPWIGRAGRTVLSRYGVAFTPSVDIKR
jgi:hypothetical protein